MNLQSNRQHLPLPRPDGGRYSLSCNTCANALKSLHPNGYSLSFQVETPTSLRIHVITKQPMTGWLGVTIGEPTNVVFFTSKKDMNSQ